MIHKDSQSKTGEHKKRKYQSGLLQVLVYMCISCALTINFYEITDAEKKKLNRDRDT